MKTDNDNVSGVAGMVLFFVPIGLLVAAVSVQSYADHVSYENTTLLRTAFAVIFLACLLIGLCLGLYMAKGSVSIPEIGLPEADRPSGNDLPPRGSRGTATDPPSSGEKSGTQSERPTPPYVYEPVLPSWPVSQQKSERENLEERKAEQRKKDEQELHILEGCISWGKFHGLDKSDTFGASHNFDEERAEELRRKIRGY